MLSFKMALALYFDVVTTSVPEKFLCKNFLVRHSLAKSYEHHRLMAPLSSPFFFRISKICILYSCSSYWEGKVRRKSSFVELLHFLNSLAGHDEKCKIQVKKESAARFPY